MKIIIFIVICLISVFFNAQKTDFAPSKLVTEEYFGTKIEDEYRNLEDLKES